MPLNAENAKSAVKTGIIATGSYLPPAVLANADLTQFPADSLSMIEKKTGVRQRHHAGPDQVTSDLAAEAAVICLQRAGVEATSVDAIILATSSPDRIQPATATRVQQRLGATGALAFDLNAVCSGFVYGLQVASSLIQTDACHRVLLIGAEIYSRFLNPEDFSTYPYFGDGAGAVLLAGTDPDSKSHGRVVRSVLHADGAGADVIQIPAGGTMLPIGRMKQPTQAYFRMIGREVYNFAISKGAEVLRELCAAAGIKVNDLNLIIPHQANINIIRELASGLGIDANTFFVNLDRVGNTAAASIPIALDEALAAGRIHPGDLVALVAFGGGLTWGASLIQY